jgi:hypothetical protein
MWLGIIANINVAREEVLKKKEVKGSFCLQSGFQQKVV